MRSTKNVASDLARIQIGSVSPGRDEFGDDGVLEKYLTFSRENVVETHFLRGESEKTMFTDDS